MKRFLNIYFIGIVLFGIGLIVLMASSNQNKLGAVLCTIGIGVPFLWNIASAVIGALKSKKK